MIKKTLYFGNPVYLSLKNAQLVIKLPEVVKSDVLPKGFKQQSEITKPIEDLGVVVLGPEKSGRKLRRRRFRGSAARWKAPGRPRPR